MRPSEAIKAIAATLASGKADLATLEVIGDILARVESAEPELPAPAVEAIVTLAAQPFLIGLRTDRSYPSSFLMQALDRGDQLQDAVAGGDFASAKRLAAKEVVSAGTGFGRALIAEQMERGAKLRELLSQL